MGDSFMNFDRKTVNKVQYTYNPNRCFFIWNTDLQRKFVGIPTKHNMVFVNKHITTWNNLNMRITTQTIHTNTLLGT